MTKKTIKISRLIAFVLGGVFAAMAGRVSAQTLPITSGLQLWLKADAGVTTNSAGLVTGWADSSGNGNTAAPTNNNTSFSPTYLANSLNGLPTLRFPGGSKALDVPDVSISPSSTISGLTNNVTIIVVKEDDSYAGYRAGVSKSLGNAPGPFDTYNNAAASAGQSIFYLRHGTANVSVTGNSFKPQPGVYQVLSYTYANGTIKQYINDAVAAYFNAAMQPNGNSNAIWSAQNGPGPLRIGSREDFVTQLVGNMAEVLVYQPALTDSQLFDVVNDYLKPKWGLAFDPAPVISITSPASGATPAANTVVPVVISASSPTGLVASVSLYGNGSLIGTTTSTNYNLAVSSLTPGPVTLSAVVIDQLGRPATSAPVNITFTGPAAPTTPPSSGLMVWLNASYGVTTNADGTVSSWADESLNGNAATGVTNEPYSNITGTNVPTVEPVWSNNIANGQPVVHFNGSNSILAIPDAGVSFLTGDFTTFAVARFSQAFFSTPQMIWTKASNNVPCPVDWYFPSSGQTIGPIYAVSGNTTIERGNGGVNSGATSPATAALSLNQFNNVGVSYHGTSVSMYSGANVYYSNIVASPAGDGASNLPVTIGLRDDGATALYGDVAEILIYQGAQSSANVQSIASYLNGKYNIAQPYYANPAPVVNITLPGAGSIAAPATLTFSATATSQFGAVTNVALYANGIRLATLASLPYSVQVNLLTPGVVTLTAVATDNWGIQTTSAPVVVTLTGSAAAPAITNGLALWLKPDAGIVTNSTGNVIEWDDQSGAGNNAYQPSSDGVTPGIPPLLIPNAQNGFPVVRFTPPTNEAGSNVFLDIIDNGTITPYSASDFAIFAVTRIPAYGNYYEILSDCNAGSIGFANPFEYRINSGTGLDDYIVGVGNANGPSSTGVAAPPASSTYFSIEGIVLANGVITHYLQLNTNGGGAFSYAPTASGNPIRVGGRSANNGTIYTMNGDIAEIQVYTNAVGTAEAGEIVNYLSDKYALPQVQLAVNPPAITVVALTNALTPSTNVTAPGLLNIGAQIVSAAAISSVSFIVNGQTVSTQTSPPYQIPLQVLTPGTLSVVVQASDIYGFSSNSAPYTITIPGNALELPSAPPTNGMVLWLKADAGVTTNSDGTLALWNDQSGETNNASADPGGASAPSLETDPVLGVPVVAFNPNGFAMCLDVADAPSVELTSDMSLFYAVKFATFTNTLPQTIVAKTFGSSAFPFDYRVAAGTATYVRADNDGSSGINSTGLLPAGQYIVGGATVLSSVVTHYLNNVSIGSGTLGYGALDGGTPLKVGSRDDFLTQLDGNLGEVLLYNRALDGSDLQLADTYLAGRYGIAIVQLAPTTPPVGIIGLGTNGIDIAWPPGYAGWVLESSTNLLKWTPISTNPPNNQVIVNPAGKASTFYRLQIQ
ncbi:MAG TPA: Ig-like domain-containing protein [Verrucomicrobiae bacterium]